MVHVRRRYKAQNINLDRHTALQLLSSLELEPMYLGYCCKLLGTMKTDSVKQDLCTKLDRAERLGFVVRRYEARHNCCARCINIDTESVVDRPTILRIPRAKQLSGRHINTLHRAHKLWRSDRSKAGQSSSCPSNYSTGSANRGRV